MLELNQLELSNLEIASFPSSARSIAPLKRAYRQGASQDSEADKPSAFPVQQNSKILEGTLMSRAVRVRVRSNVGMDPNHEDELMTYKTSPIYSPVIAMLLLAGAEVAIPAVAQASEAKAATLDELPPMASRVRCFMGARHDMPAQADLSGLNRGWFCVPEKSASSTH
ncbi:MAG TPA: hypothetical protein VL492_12760 [Methylovirgula sp.]|nr:hypothetical protein [Methylovirgula sp.]